LTRRVIL